MLSRTFSFLLVFATISIPSLRAEEWSWPGFLGPERNGWVSGFKAPEPWPDKLSKVWQAKVGTGYGTPLVDFPRDLVYQHGREGDEEILQCLHLETGKVKWRKTWPVPFKIGGGGDFHGKGPKSSPVMSAGRLFTVSISGLVSAWNAASGKLLWQRDESSRFKPNHPYWGASTSPLVTQDRLIVHLGNDDAGTLFALDVATGKDVWTLGKDGASYSSPLLVTISGITQVVHWNHEDLVGVDPVTGKLLWRFHHPHRGTNQNMPTPVFHHGRFMVGGENRGIRCVEPKKEGDGWTVKELWHQEEVALDMSTAVMNGDLLFGMSHYKLGRFFCLDPQTGKVLWQTRGRAGDNVAFIAIPDCILALSDRGRLLVIAAKGDAYEEIAAYEVAESPTWAPPVLLEDGLLIKAHDTLTRWSFAARVRL